MRRRDQPALPSRRAELEQALLPRRLLVHVEGDRDLGLRQLDGADMDEVAPEFEAPALAVDPVDAVAWRVAGGGKGSDAGRICVLPANSLSLPARR
jgi:hypothetical protein